MTGVLSKRNIWPQRPTGIEGDHIGGQGERRAEGCPSTSQGERLGTAPSFMDL